MTQNKNLNRPSEYLLDGNKQQLVSHIFLYLLLIIVSLCVFHLFKGKVTDKNDVYSFGVILLELLLGKRSVVEKSSTEPESVVTWVRTNFQDNVLEESSLAFLWSLFVEQAVPKLSDRANLPNILDPAIKGTMDLKHLYQVAAMAVLCVQPEPSYRPLITDVLHSLIPLLPLDLGGSLRIL